MDARLRPWRLDEARFLLDIARRNPDLIRQLGPIEDESAAGLLLRSWHGQRRSASGWIWAVEVEGRPVGTVGVTNVERRHGTAWCWYWLDGEARGHGLAARALVAAASVAFDDGLFRLELAHRTNNPASCSVARRAGFAAEGIERGKLVYDGVRHDCETHARLADDPEPDVSPLPIGSADTVEAPTTAPAIATSTGIPPIDHVEDLERRVWQALVDGDGAADAALLSDDFVGLYPTGFADRTDHAGQLADGPTVADYDMSEQRLIPVADNAVLFCYRADYRRPATTTGRQSNEPAESMYVSSLWCRREDRWVNTFSQDTHLGDPVV